MPPDHDQELDPSVPQPWRNATVTTKQLKDTLELLGLRASEQEVNAMANRAKDRNRFTKGVISFKTFFDLLIKKVDADDYVDPIEESRKAFEYFDKEQKGLITAADIERV